MSAVRVVKCDVCQIEEQNPSGWFTVREAHYGNYPTVLIEQDRDRLRGHPPGGLEHACSIECLAKAVTKAATKWANKKKKA